MPVRRFLHSISRIFEHQIIMNFKSLVLELSQKPEENFLL